MRFMRFLKVLHAVVTRFTGIRLGIDRRRLSGADENCRSSSCRLTRPNTPPFHENLEMGRGFCHERRVNQVNESCLGNRRVNTQGEITRQTTSNFKHHTFGEIFRTHDRCVTLCRTTLRLLRHFVEIFCRITSSSKSNFVERIFVEYDT